MKENKTSRLASLDGWRAICIILVIGHHSVESPGFPKVLSPLFNWIFDGNLGVRIFFIISGLLITWLMLQENQKHGAVSIRLFYLRRIIRIFPVYFSYLGVLAIFQICNIFYQNNIAWFANLTFTTNYFLDQAPRTGHLWSLAVEEQFYMVWPFVFVALGISIRFLSGIKLLGLIMIISPILRVISYLKLWPPLLAPFFVWGSTFLYMDSIAIGAACALILFYHRNLVEKHIIYSKKWLTYFAFILVLFPHILKHYKVLGIITVPFDSTLQAVGISILMLKSIFYSEKGLYRILNIPFISGVGILSYSLYMWHMIAYQVGLSRNLAQKLSFSWWNVFPGWILIGILAAMLSYYILEVPFFKMRAYLRVKSLQPQNEQ